MAYTIAPATLADVDAITKIFQDGFASHPIIPHLNPNVTPEAEWAQDAEKMRSLISQDPQYGGRFYKLFDDASGEILAFTRWVFPLSHASDSHLLKRQALSEPPHPPIPGSNVALTQAFFSALFSGRREHVNSRETYFLHILCVAPVHQRKSLGRMLLEDVLKVIDEDGKRCYVEASPVGEGLYYKLGWEDCGEVVLDLGGLGVKRFREGEEVCRMKVMMREPQAQGK